MRRDSEGGIELEIRIVEHEEGIGIMASGRKVEYTSQRAINVYGIVQFGKTFVVPTIMPTLSIYSHAVIEYPDA